MKASTIWYHAWLPPPPPPHHMVSQEQSKSIAHHTSHQGKGNRSERELVPTQQLLQATVGPTQLVHPRNQTHETKPKKLNNKRMKVQRISSAASCSQSEVQGSGQLSTCC